MVAAIIALVTAVLASIPYFAKWFPAKTPEQKAADDAKAIQAIIDKMRGDGRP